MATYPLTSMSLALLMELPKMQVVSSTAVANGHPEQNVNLAMARSKAGLSTYSFLNTTCSVGDLLRNENAFRDTAVASMNV